ncbi:MAG: FkbM family methyltransferase, partial [Saprospiraceae bacterium]
MMLRSLSGRELSGLINSEEISGTYSILKNKNSMLGKISRLLQLFKMYGTGAFRLIFNPLLGKQTWLMYEGEKIWLNFDQSTYYHLLHSMDKLKKLVEAIPAISEGVIIDGGANHGIFSLLAARRFPEKKIYAVEPYGKVLPFLKKNVQGKKVKIIEKALAGEDGEVAFFTSEVSDQMGSVIRENVWEFLSEGDTIREERIPAISLPALVQQEGITKIAAIKLDVQGA